MKVEQVGTCTAACTGQFLRNKQLNIVGANNHMHYLGKASSIYYLNISYTARNLYQLNANEVPLTLH